MSRIQQVHGADVNLDFFTVRHMRGTAHQEIACDLCGEAVSLLANGDTLAVLVAQARDHILGGNCNGEKPR